MEITSRSGNEVMLEDLLKMASSSGGLRGPDRRPTSEAAAKIDWEGDHEDWKDC
jgi:hypothetical protein